jgi:hypothetical protein
LITASRQEPRQNIQVVLIGRTPRASNFVEYRLQVSPIIIQTAAHWSQHVWTFNLKYYLKGSIKLYKTYKIQ